MQGFIFRENSGRVDEHFSLFFVKNFMETKESLFGYFSSKYAAAEIGLSEVVL